MNNILQTALQIKNNPNQLGQILYQSGKINQEQFNAIQGKGPADIGQYLLNNNIMSQNQLSQLQQKAQMFKGLF